MTGVATAPATKARAGWPAFAGSGLAVAGLIIVAGNVNVPKGENGGTGPAIFTAVVCVVLAGVLFGLLLPRIRATSRATLILGVVTVLSLAVFWSGITAVLAAGTLWLTSRAQADDKVRRPAQIMSIVPVLLAVGVTLAGSHLL